MSAAETVPCRVPAARAAGGPGPWPLILIFWAAFAGAVLAVQVIDPTLFRKQDPDSLMRLVQVRDLLAGQGWFDLVQHRFNPPDGISMHWSRLIDAPLAGLVALGSLFGDGESFAIAVWPVLLLLGFLAATVFAATRLAPAAAAPTLLLSLTSFTTLLLFLPTNIDHHGAQLALLMATVAAALRLEIRPLAGLAAGLFSAASLAVGLEMLPYAAALGALIALRWAATGSGAAGAGLFGLGLAVAAPAFALAVTPPEAATACDALSWSYALPIATAGGSLGALAFSPVARFGRSVRLAGLALAAAAAAIVFRLVAPHCLTGPYGGVSAELEALWLSTIAEAQPLPAFAAHEPVAALASLGPPAVALAIALRRARAHGAVWTWTLPAALIGLALAMSFWQVRTLPAANALAVPVLGAWLAELAARRGIASIRPLRRALPLAAAFLAATPLVHLAGGWAAVQAISVTAGIAPVERPDAAPAALAGLNSLQRDCLDDSARELLAQLPPGQVLAPVFYGPAVLALSPHSAVAGPYHRGGAAILDALRAFGLPPEQALPIVRARGVDYVAVCVTARETALSRAESPDGLLAALVDGAAIDSMEPVAADATTLRVWRVRR